MRLVDKKDPFGNLIRTRQWRKVALVLGSTVVITAVAVVILRLALDTGFRITSPKNGGHYRVTSIVVKGKARAGAIILKDESMWPDPTVTTADAVGNWSCVWNLSRGKNKIRLHTKDHEDHKELTIYRDEPAISSGAPASLPSCSGSPFFGAGP